MIQVHDLHKSYGHTEVLRGVDLTVRDGEVHALLGANGAGKSTLIKCLSGAQRVNGGSIELDGSALGALSPRAAREAGIAIIYQHFSLIPTLSVADNIFLGSERRRWGSVTNFATHRKEARAVLARLGLDIDPATPVAMLSVAEQQMVEIAKALARDPRVLVLDEPTASLSEVEAVRLADTLRSLRAQGVAILYVTHLLHEVFDLADRVTVLRDGIVVLAQDVAAVGQADLIEAITGRSLSGVETVAAPPVDGAPVLELEGFRVVGCGPVDLTVRAGEVVVVFGLLGAGRSSLLEGIFGARRREAGRLSWAGRPVTFRHPAQAMSHGLALVPGDRLKQALFGPMALSDNLLMAVFGRLAGARIWRSRSREREVATRAVTDLHVIPPHRSQAVGLFSGGNQQKAAVGRWLNAVQQTRLLLLDEPTQGIDVGARADLYALVRRFAQEGGACVVTTSDPEETQALADRVVILYRGQVTGELHPDEVDEGSLLAAASPAPPTQPTPSPLPGEILP